MEIKIKKAKKIRGMTLLEIMLVLAIGMSITLMGLKQYQRYNQEKNIELLKYNVDLIFQAMKGYYSANCAMGTLSPRQQTSLLNPVIPMAIPVYISITSGQPYLPSTFNGSNPLVAAGGGGSGSYTARFNPRLISGRNQQACFVINGVSSCTSQVNPNSYILLWVAQVAVQLANPAMAVTYKGLAGADCASKSLSCSSPVTSGPATYLIWERLPSFASPKINSDLWLFDPYVKQFNLQYTHDPLGEMSRGLYEDWAQDYYGCGG